MKEINSINCENFEIHLMNLFFYSSFDKDHYENTDGVQN